MCPWEPGIYRWHPTQRRWQYWHDGAYRVRAGWSDTGGPGDLDEHGGPLDPAHRVYYGAPRVVAWEGETTPPPPEPRPAPPPPPDTLHSTAQEVVNRYIGGSPLSGALGEAIERLAAVLATSRTTTPAAAPLA